MPRRCKAAKFNFPQTFVKIEQKTIKFHGKIASFVLYLKNVFVFYFKEPW